jgi:membrane protease YdiL (CAAX protease family)
MLPAAAFGLVLGVAAVATDGAIPGMVMHAVNNLAVTIVVPALPGLDANVTAHPLPIALLSLALTAAGLTLLAATPRGASE